MNCPEGAELIAEGGDYTIYEYDGWYYLRGLGRTTYVFCDKSEWDLFSAVIRLADLKIQGESE